jgi:hypothetical protein
MHDLATSVVADFLKMASARLIFQPILGGLAGAFFGNTPMPSTSFTAGGSATAASAASHSITASDTSGFTGYASGGIAMSPTIAKIAEHGPEEIRPLGSAGLGMTVQIVDQRSGGSPVQVSETTGPGGERVLRALIRDEQRRSLATGALDSDFREAYGLRRGAVRR